MTKAPRRNRDGQDGDGAGTPRDVAHARSDDIGGGSCGIDQVKRGKRMRGASTATCDAGDGVGSSSTGLRGLIGCTASKVEQEDMVRRRHMKDATIKIINHTQTSAIKIQVARAARATFLVIY